MINHSLLRFDRPRLLQKPRGFVKLVLSKLHLTQARVTAPFVRSQLGQPLKDHFCLVSIACSEKRRAQMVVTRCEVGKHFSGLAEKLQRYGVIAGLLCCDGKIEMSQRFFRIDPCDVGKASARLGPKQIRCIHDPQRGLTRRIDRFLLHPFELEPEVVAKLRIKLLQIGRHGNVHRRNSPDPHMLRDCHSQDNESGERNHPEDPGFGP